MSNLNDFNGRAVDRITLPEGRKDIYPTAITRLVFESSYHGDHDELWVVVYDWDGNKEIERYNVRHIQSIRWAEQAEVK